MNFKEELVVARRSFGSGVTVQSTSKLFDVRGYQRDSGFHRYEPDATAQRFFMLRQEHYPGDRVVVENWFSELRDMLKRSK